MAFAPKTDYCGLLAALSPSGSADASPLVIRDANDNVSVEKYQPQGQDGSYIGTEVYGRDSAPTNSYALKADIAAEEGAIKLNRINEVDGRKYALENVEITTGAGSAPTVSATCQEIEDDATDEAQCHYAVPAFAIAKKHHAQILFGAFSPFASGCQLTACSATVGGSINKDKVEGVKVSSDINGGVITVTGTVLQTGDAVPELTPAEGFIVTGLLNCQNPEAAYKSYTFELQKTLAKSPAA